jgi:hypothetical protein
MDVTHGHLVPHELLRIAYYYTCDYAPLAIHAFIRDPFVHPFELRHRRKGKLGEYLGSEGVPVIRLFLLRVRALNSFAHSVPPPMCFWLGLLEVMLHEIGHHRQCYNPEYRDDAGEAGYWDAWPERDARQFALREIKRLATLDDDLFMPGRSADMGFLGAVTSRWLETSARKVREHPQRWALTHKIREAKLRSVHVGCRDPLAGVAEAEGRVWHDKRGHAYRYLRLGQAVRRGLLDEALAGPL